MDLAGKNILVTGAAGMMGSHALLALKDMPVKVRAVDWQKKPLVFSNNIAHLEADLTDAKECQKAVRGMDYVLNFAAKISRRAKTYDYLLTNLKINALMLEAAYQSGVKKYLWLSSSVAYPPQNHPLKEEEMFLADPADNYFGIGWTTRYIENLCRMYATKVNSPMTTIVLRPTAIYGEYADFNPETSHVLPALIRKVVERQSPIEIWGGGEVKRDFVYAGDVARACILALEKTDNFSALNIGLGKSYSSKELLDSILKVDDYKTAKVVFDKTKGKNLHSIEVDCSKAKKLLGWKPEVSLEEGIKRTIAWYKQNNEIPNHKFQITNKLQ